MQADDEQQVDDVIDEGENVCPICIDDFSSYCSSITVLPCGHLIHSKCYLKLRSIQSPVGDRCPICRENLPEINFSTKLRLLFRRRQENCTTDQCYSPCLTAFMCSVITFMCTAAAVSVSNI